ncbi:MAG: VOC family protein [Jatrophihabitans sp.]
MLWSPTPAVSWSTGPIEFESDEVVRLRAPDSRGIRRIIFWRVPEPKTTKTRMHIDLASKTPKEEVERLIGLGANCVDQLPGWTVMTDPAGNEFCLG